MNGRNFTVGVPSNPLLQIVYFIVGGIILIGALLMGAVILSLVFGLALIAGIVVWIRVWWLRRKILKAGGEGAAAAGQEPGSSGRVIEVEYTVVDERSDEGRD